jgi:hypothetical protein
MTYQTLQKCRGGNSEEWRPGLKPCNDFPNFWYFGIHGFVNQHFLAKLFLGPVSSFGKARGALTARSRRNRKEAKRVSKPELAQVSP